MTLTPSLTRHGAAFLLAAGCMLPLGAAKAQRNSVRTVRADAGIDTARLDALRSQLDSLSRTFNESPMSVVERERLSRQMTSLVMALAQLTQPDIERRLSTEINNEAARAGRLLAQANAWQSGSDVFANGFGPTLAPTLVPTGWIGLNVDAPQASEVRGQQQFIRYFEYPQVVSVEPNSPAERAGLLAGDLLIAYNGADLREHAINVTQLLRPSAHVAVTVRRDGDARVFHVMVAPAPAQLQSRRHAFVVMSAPALAAAPMPAPRAMRVPSMPGVPMLTMPMVPAMPDLDAASAPIAGARLLELHNSDLARALGARAGVLVLDVAPGPANRAGLRGGDVIVRAAGHSVTSIGELRRLVASGADERSVPLEIVRAKHAKRLMLAW